MFLRIIVALFLQNCICWILFGTLTIIFDVLEEIVWKIIESRYISAFVQLSTKLSISVEDFLKLSAILVNYQQNYRHGKELICWYFPETESRRRKKYECFLPSFKQTTINLNHSFYIMSNGTTNKVRTDSLKTFLKPSNIAFQSLAFSGLSCSLSSKKALANTGYQFREIPYDWIRKSIPEKHR